ncbi:hypothetical protein CBER1_11717 [Cercospora berteroae]|uniref:Uncharacterized protein n=1 Tax=Cercospora berteroae TaxID=357750 RepID=A0A2S6CMZ1_9PEZI|nr:hypothetical protein CBER1_11717 [Cercospora berteroae]
MTLPGAFPPAGHADMTTTDALPGSMTTATANAAWTQNPFLLSRHLVWRLRQRGLRVDRPHMQAVVGAFARYDERVWLLLQWACQIDRHVGPRERERAIQQARARPAPPDWDWISEEYDRQEALGPGLVLDNEASASSTDSGISSLGKEDTLHEDVIESVARRIFCKLIKTWAPSHDASLLAFDLCKMPETLDFYIDDELRNRGNSMRSPDRRCELYSQQLAALHGRLCEFITTSDMLHLVPKYCPNADVTSYTKADLEKMSQGLARWEQGTLFGAHISWDMASTLHKVLLVVLIILGVPMTKQQD